MQSLPRLTAEQTAERLGVKLETLYAYVARGRLSRERTADGSTFDALEVERFASSRRRSPAPGARHGEGRPLMVIETDFALIEDGELYYRGRAATELADEPFETVARWALTGRWEADARFSPGAGLDAARAAAAALPPGAGDRDRQLVAVTALAAADPLRTSLDPADVAGAAERLVAGMVAVLPSGAADPAGTSLASALWSRLSPQPARAGSVRTLNAALVLLLDHDLAVSTLAARAAASARATPYAVVVTGLGALDSPLHGNASRAAHRLLSRVIGGDEPARAVADAVVDGRGPLPGFGQPLYPSGDPRARILLGMLSEDPDAAPVVDAVERVSAVLRDRTGAEPNVDLALAALSLAGGMRDDAGEVVFATARSVGWIVHAIAEYAERPLRLRPVGRYAGPSA
ncbi:citrate synthase [Leifsonia sp. NPDC080035]|uniref:citrate synthase (unknown stereospecificity) n=1 Tax=Leifsonia sp. NPDC080035 TaxID=3143936 RepID=A0AAU7GDM7_9MICO